MVVDTETPSRSAAEMRRDMRSLSERLTETVGLARTVLNRAVRTEAWRGHWKHRATLASRAVVQAQEIVAEALRREPDSELARELLAVLQTGASKGCECSPHCPLGGHISWDDLKEELRDG